MKTNIEKLYHALHRPFLLLSAFTDFRNDGSTKLTVTKKDISIQGSFQDVLIDGDMSLILTNEPAGTLRIEGYEQDVNKVRWRVKNNKLIIDAGCKNNQNELAVHLSAARLVSMRINGDVDISSDGVIKSDELRISMNGKVTVKIRTTGNLSFDTPDYYDLLWRAPSANKRK